MTDTLYSIQEVVVEGKPFQEIIPSQKLNAQKLEALNAHSVADALRYFAGVQLKDYGGMGGLKTVDVRGMGSQHVGVFYDGVQLGNAQNGVVDLGKFSLDDMEEISLYNGQKSEIFQTAKDFSTASTIYLRSKRPRFKDGKNTNLLARYKAGSIHLVNPSFRLEQKLSSTFNMSVSGEYTYSGGEYKFRYKNFTEDNHIPYGATTKRKNGDIAAYRLEMGVNGVVANGFLETKLYYYDSHRGLPGAVITNIFERGDRQWDRNFFGQASYTKEITSFYKIKAKGKFAFDYTRYLSDTVVMKTEYDNKFYQQEAYASIAQLYSVKSWWDVSLSTDFQWNKLNATSKRRTNGGSVYNSDDKYPMRYATYVSLASSVDLGRFKAQANILGTFVKNSKRGGVGASTYNEFTPAVFVGYQPIAKEDFTLRAFYKRIFRLPTLNDLYYTKTMTSTLRPEYTHQYNIGASYNKQLKHPFFKGFSLKVDAYYLDVKDKIVAVPREQFRWSMMNIAGSDAIGVDASASLFTQVEKVNVDFSLNYSYNKSEIKGDKRSTDYKHQVPYTPWHTTSAVMNARYQGWMLNYSYNYVGERYKADNILANRIEPWYTHDVSVHKTLTFKHFKAKASVEMNNFLNKYYDIIPNYPMPGRSIKFIITLEL